MIDDREDIYYLYWSELLEFVGSQEKNQKQSLVASRRKAMESVREVVLPDLIIGSEQPPVSMATSDTLKGIPTSLGTYSGPARIVKGINDFEKMGKSRAIPDSYRDDPGSGYNGI